ncbi:hypothetical protein VTI74DRAFT_9438 [Chaetomium olivicolor]
MPPPGPGAWNMIVPVHFPPEQIAVGTARLYTTDSIVIRHPLEILLSLAAARSGSEAVADTVPVLLLDALETLSPRPETLRAACCCLPYGKHHGAGANAEPACFDKPSRMKHGFCSFGESSQAIIRCGMPVTRADLASPLAVRDQLSQPVLYKPSLIGPVKQKAGQHAPFRAL